METKRHGASRVVGIDSGDRYLERARFAAETLGYGLNSRGRHAEACVGAFREACPALGIMQWFHYRDPWLDDAVAWLKRLGVTHVRTGLSWADSFREDAIGWFDRQMDALEDFEVTVTFCFTPEHLGLAPHHTSPPADPAQFADFCGAMIERYAPARAKAAVA